MERKKVLRLFNLQENLQAMRQSDLSARLENSIVVFRESVLTINYQNSSNYTNVPYIWPCWPTAADLTPEAIGWLSAGYRPAVRLDLARPGSTWIADGCRLLENATELQGSKRPYKKFFGIVLQGSKWIKKVFPYGKKYL